MTGNLAIARREPLGNNRLLDSSSASAVALSAPSCGPSQIPPPMPANGTGQRVRLAPTRRASGDATATAHPDTERYETMFVSNLDVIESVIRYVCQRQKLAGSEAEDFGSEVKVRLVDRDYEVLRKFQERSTLRTYLTIVIQRIYLDYRNHLWGKWRPSAEAQRLGPVAVRLETVMARDGFSFDQACEYLRTNEHIVAADSELNAIAVRLPIRVRRAMVGDEELETVADTTSRVDDRLLYQRATRRRSPDLGCPDRRDAVAQRSGSGDSTASLPGRPRGGRHCARAPPRSETAVSAFRCAAAAPAGNIGGGRYQSGGGV